jgi:hypothetical protein
MENIPLVEITNLDLLLKEDQKTREFVYDKYNRVLI